MPKKVATKEPVAKGEVRAARERVSAEIERIYLATKGGGHAE
jgi:hypothetical protein